MKCWNRNVKESRRRQVLTVLASLLVLLGCCVILFNAVKFSIGYFACRTASVRLQNMDALGAEDTQDGKEQDIRIQDTRIQDNKIQDIKEKDVKIQSGEEQDTEANGISLYSERPKDGEKIGELYIPKLKALLPIYEGTEGEELDKGVGHFSGSVLPGEEDNTVLAGHRDTVFRKLGEVGKGDFFLVRTLAGEFKYKVYKVRIVDKDDKTVIVPKPRATLTVSTCYPFSYIGSAPKRYVLVAYLVSEKTDEKTKEQIAVDLGQ